MTHSRNARSTVLIPLGIAVLAALLFLVVDVARPAPAEAEPSAPVLPAATGAHPVGSRTLHLVDRARRDPWVEQRMPRHLRVTMLYPTTRRAAAQRPPARYLTPAESRAFLDFQEDEQGAPVPEDLPRGILARTDVGAVRGGPVLAARGGRPTVVMSPGFGLPRATLLFLATELASGGYVVALVDHAHESSGMQLPDGRLLRCAACDVEYYGRVATVRARDVDFLLDRLTTRGSRWAEHVSDDVAVVGHSIGGNAALSAMRTDRRVRAVVDLDGTLFDPVRRPLRRPVLLLGTDDLHRPDGDDVSWLHTWRRLEGPRTWLTVAGSTHGSFTDGPLLVEQLVPGAPGPELDPGRGLDLTRIYVTAFLDEHLRGRESPLLDGPSPDVPEVTHHAPPDPS